MQIHTITIARIIWCEQWILHYNNVMCVYGIGIGIGTDYRWMCGTNMKGGMNETMTNNVLYGYGESSLLQEIKLGSQEQATSARVRKTLARRSTWSCPSSREVWIGIRFDGHCLSLRHRTSASGHCLSLRLRTSASGSHQIDLTEKKGELDMEFIS
jgi:hypothetical protein